jgi:glycine cleavage system H lipoate-binding protein
MSILFVLLMFLLIISFSYFRTRNEVTVRPQPATGPQAPRMEREYGFQIPQGYCFHPGHTWTHREGSDNARVGIDSFATNLIGKIDRIDIIGENRWVRQGQKLITIHAGGETFDLVAPIEGVVTSTNRDLVEEPTLATRDPYQKGWVATVKSPDLAINQKNLMQGGMVAPWLQNNVTRLNGMVAQLAPSMAADGGLPTPGLLVRVTPELRQKLLKEFFLA